VGAKPTRSFVLTEAGSSEIDYWLGRFRQAAANEDSITALVASDEYYKKGT
jgi:hypothetical protein